MFFYKIKIKTAVMGMLAISCFLFSCVNDSYYEDVSDLDSQLLSLIDEKSNGIGPYFFQLPNTNDYASIPQDPLNPITSQKVALGKMLVHETATGGNAKMESAVETFSCASCHPVAAGFYSETYKVLVKAVKVLAV
ncbi:hypothetical protein N7U66_20870 [Lacinutrix neustonica]|uniref:Cytochrome c domain-containing protein n=1 Tax=Lacinutrix neustonica TaxID=2980107 RepID=A0A9E8MWE1_9FLAO|nr:hypothetical protein [Lacinutrix neustonica]WAC02185.1 hypothetical protein N7U66_20870 [Lacinutrix neustonica]